MVSVKRRFEICLMSKNCNQPRSLFFRYRPLNPDIASLELGKIISGPALLRLPLNSKGLVETLFGDIEPERLVECDHYDTFLCV
jgi:hypothetical protein